MVILFCSRARADGGSIRLIACLFSKTERTQSVENGVYAENKRRQCEGTEAPICIGARGSERKSGGTSFGGTSWPRLWMASTSSEVIVVLLRWEADDEIRWPRPLEELQLSCSNSSNYTAFLQKPACQELPGAFGQSPEADGKILVCRW
jgi:hypothetical protein